MIASIFLFAILGAFFLFNILILAAAIFPDESLPQWLRGPARHARAVYDLVDVLIKDDEGAAPSHAAPPVPKAPAALRPVAVESVAVREQVDVAEARFFLMQEIAVHCKFEPRIENDVLTLTKRELGRLIDYCNFAFEDPLTPRQLLARVGLSLRME